jgi:hypothetical protein
MQPHFRFVCASLLICGVVALSGFSQPLEPSPTDTIRVLWRDPGSIGSKDLKWGSGGPERAPKPPFTFVSENLSGTKPKVDVKDAAGVTWSVKFAGAKAQDNEVHSEIAACRIVWSLGYFADENYFVPSGRIEGVKDLKRAAEAVGADGSFSTARFERRPPEAERRGSWDLEDNRFKGSRELAGLQMLMQLVGNWDLQPANLAVLHAPLPNGDVEERYLISDLGRTFGAMRGGVKQAPSSWDIADYGDRTFLNGVKMNRLEFRNPLTGRDPFSVPLAHAQWFTNLASQLSMTQIRSAFEAAGASPADVDAFANAFKVRIDLLRAALNHK